MKRFGPALAAIFTVLAFTTPVAAFAADKTTTYSSEQIGRGKKEAPAAVATTGKACTVTDAAYIGTSTSKDDKGKEVKQTVYEVSCSEGLGYAVVVAPDQTKAYDCVSLIGNANLNCKLPENADPKRGLQSTVAQAGSQCVISDARYLGGKPTGENFYEVGCGAEPGFVLQTMAGQAPRMIGCDQVSGALACKFTTQAQLDAVANQKAGVLLARSGKTCQLSKVRTIGALQSGDYAYEVACQDGSGYILEALASGDYHQAINCANAGDACKLTDSTKAESTETGTYTRLAKGGGYQCDVAKYRFIGMDTKSNGEVVELQCSNRSDGVIALFPADDKSPAKFFDCVQAGSMGQSCKLTDQAQLYPKYTQALNARGKKSCTVSGAHWLAATTTGDNFVEVACSDGLPGWVLVMTPQGSASDVRTCGEVKSSGVSCSLPGNTK